DRAGVGCTPRRGRVQGLGLRADTCAGFRRTRIARAAGGAVVAATFLAAFQVHRRSVRRDQGGQPIEDVRQQPPGGVHVVVAIRLVAAGQVDAAVVAKVQEALNLGVDVELVLTGVGDVHR